jgi:hypothetical protein
MQHGKIVRSSAKIVCTTTRQAKFKTVEFFSGASEKQSTVRHLSILNTHITHIKSVTRIIEVFTSSFFDKFRDKICIT